MSTQKRPCARCGCRLNSYNTSPVCGPCRFDHTPAELEQFFSDRAAEEEIKRKRRAEEANRQSRRRYAQKRAKKG